MIKAQRIMPPCSFARYPLPVLIIFVMLVSVSLSATAAKQNESDRWALLVGVDKCQALGKLKYCAEDSKILGETLKQIGNYQKNRVKILTDEAKEYNRYPTLGTLKSSIKTIERIL